MEYWEFSIQREGDRSWLPLESPQVEILEGRYRAIARLSRGEVPVEIRVVYYLPDDDPDRRRVRKRSRRTTAQGLVVLLPFTDLQAGIWELSVCGQVAPGAPGLAWQYGVQLRVLSAVTREPEPTPAEVLYPPVPQGAYGLVLEREGYWVSGGAPVILAGRIERWRDDAPDPFEGGYLQVCLRDPQDKTPILESQYDIPEGTLPMAFSEAVVLPPQCDRRLMLGEVKLVDRAMRELDGRSFTVTANLEALLENVSTGGETLPGFRTRLLGRSTPPILDLSAFEWIAARGETPVSRFEPGDRPPLPPQLNAPEIPATTASGLDLPEFGKEMGEPTAPAEVLESEEDAPEEIEAVVESEETEERALADLQLGDRFESRLHHIAKNDDLARWMETAAENPFDAAIDEPTPQPPPDWEAREIVVDTDPLDLVPSGLTSRPQPPDLPESFALPPNEPIPAPTLNLPKELVAGKTVEVKVKLPQVPSRIFVKIWPVDRQTRTVLGEAQWATDFVPTGFGETEAIASVEIPYGCLEVQIEAMSVEAHTHRESYKVSWERSVQQPGAPRLPLESRSL